MNTQRSKVATARRRLFVALAGTSAATRLAVVSMGVVGTAVLLFWVRTPSAYPIAEVLAEPDEMDVQPT